MRSGFARSAQSGLPGRCSHTVREADAGRIPRDLRQGWPCGISVGFYGIRTAISWGHFPVTASPIPPPNAPRVTRQAHTGGDDDVSRDPAHSAHQSLQCPGRSHHRGFRTRCTSDARSVRTRSDRRCRRGHRGHCRFRVASGADLPSLREAEQSLNIPTPRGRSREAPPGNRVGASSCWGACALGHRARACLWACLGESLGRVLGRRASGASLLSRRPASNFTPVGLEGDIRLSDKLC